MNPRLQLRLLKKPEPRPVMPKPRYAPVSLHEGRTVDRRDAWRERYEAHQAEQMRAAAIAYSKTIA